jgi:hypothetical protein
MQTVYILYINIWVYIMVTIIMAISILQYLLEAGWATEKWKIGVTQPRRVAVVTVRELSHYLCTTGTLPDSNEEKAKLAVKCIPLLVVFYALVYHNLSFMMTKKSLSMINFLTTYVWMLRKTRRKSLGLVLSYEQWEHWWGPGDDQVKY